MASYGITAFIDSIEQFLGFLFFWKCFSFNLELLSEVLMKMAVLQI